MSAKSTLPLAFLIFTFLPQASASGYLFYNATTDAGQIDCIYPVSGQYALLQRLLYYALLLFSVISQKSPWLVAGALGTAMTFAASAALHAVILAGVSHDSLLDLDCLGTFAIVSVGSLAASVFFDYSELLRESPARPVFRYWAAAMMVGTVCSMAAMWREYPGESPCYSTNEAGVNGTDLDEPILLSSTAQLALIPFNCTYSCFSKRQAFRNPVDIAIVPAATVSEARNKLLAASTYLSLIFGIIVSGYRLIKVHRYYTRSELRYSAQQWCTHPDCNRSAVDYGKYGRAKREAAREAGRLLEKGQRRYRAGAVTHVLAAVCLIVVVLNETFIYYGTNIPMGEESYTVGQWGPWVAVISAVVGSVIAEHHRPRYEERMEVLRDEGLLGGRDPGSGDSLPGSQTQGVEYGTGAIEKPKPVRHG
ncbi:hypothetical protein BJY00DRAFT_286379 [Aspergillus carlsbadensis]|nr:hypothetical protein BJY00DRAFT_286379 [Aspergillus carlsbadensis]